MAGIGPSICKLKAPYSNPAWKPNSGNQCPAGLVGALEKQAANKTSVQWRLPAAGAALPTGQLQPTALQWGSSFARSP